MNILIFFSIFLISQIRAEDTPTFDNADTGLNTTQLLDKYKYPYHVYTIKTEDGYELKVIRMLPTNQNGPGAGKVVFLNHGVVSTSEMWLFLGPRFALAYMLSDAGYDVWLQNNRGNGASMGGGPSGSEFWDFSLDEMGKLDTPPAIDLALSTTKKSDLTFICHSQGCTLYAIMCLQRPEYAAKISRLIALSPLFNMKFPSVTHLPPATFTTISKAYTINFDLGSYYASVARKCLLEPTGLACFFGYLSTFGWTPREMSIQFLKIILAVFPSSSSAKNIMQVVQWFGHDDIFMYDYGFYNTVHYNSDKPPIYNMTLVAPNTPKYLYYGNEDKIIPPHNNRYIIPRMKCVIQGFELPYSFTDTAFGLSAKDKVNINVLNILAQSVPSCL